MSPHFRRLVISGLLVTLGAVGAPQWLLTGLSYFGLWAVCSVLAALLVLINDQL